MKAGNQTLLAPLLGFSERLLRMGWRTKMPAEEPPLRSALFSADQMEQHGKALAASHTLTRGGAADQLLPRLAANEALLAGVCNLLTGAVEGKRRITPAGEWLLDNFYLIEEQIRTAKRHLPPGYSRELPRLAHGPSARLPRVYDLALETISHGDGRVDAESLRRFVAAYQTVTPLKLGELWAVPIMLRLALIENLRRVAVRIRAGRVERNLADSWADQMMEIAEKDPKSLILVVADMARSVPPMTTPFVSEFARRLQGQSPALALPLTWVEQLLSESHLTIEQLVQSENQQQAAEQVSISNSIASLRFLGAMDWPEFVEAMSVVERTLREDPAQVYARMEFATRDRYRHAVERNARNSRLSEDEVARAAIGLAHAGAAGHGRRPARGACRFLSDRQGVASARASGRGTSSPQRGVPKRLGAIAFAPVSGCDRAAHRHPCRLPGGGSRGGQRAAHDWVLVPIGLLCILAGSQLAVALVNWLATLLTAPRVLPRMDFAEAIPPESRTLVAIPTMLTSAQNIDDLVNALEVRFLANRASNLHFCLLTDFTDAQQETLPQDGPLLRLAQHGIDTLNAKYAGEQADTFFLFHRPRRWNHQEEVWMGLERKRGKLAALNALLRGASGEDFSLVVGETGILLDVKYVITLDTDTQLPRGCARQLIGAMAHPLNRARYDPVEQRVSEGYGILQPRVSVSLPGTNRSRYARLYGGDAGIDPYTRTVSDVYQDVFQEGSFIGKGIYDIDAFERALDGRLPQSRILSHDLLEGCYARAGLLSDVSVV